MGQQGEIGFIAGCSPEEYARAQEEKSRARAREGLGGRFTWSDQMGPRSRRSWLLLVQGPEVHIFSGSAIAGVVAVVSDGYTQNGKWSHTTFELELAPGVRPIAGRDGWETGRFVEGLAAATRTTVRRWTDVANALGVPLPVAQAWLLSWRPKAAARLDETEAALAEVDEIEPTKHQETTISFGAPSRSERESGFWAWPVRVSLLGQEIARLSPDASDRWAVTGDERVRVLDSTRSSGPGGGYVSLRLAVPHGAVVKHG